MEGTARRVKPPPVVRRLSEYQLLVNGDVPFRASEAMAERRRRSQAVCGLRPNPPPVPGPGFLAQDTISYSLRLDLVRVAECRRHFAISAIRTTLHTISYSLPSGGTAAVPQADSWSIHGRNWSTARAPAPGREEARRDIYIYIYMRPTVTWTPSGLGREARARSDAGGGSG